MTDGGNDDGGADATDVTSEVSAYRDALETLILTAIIAREARQDTAQRLKSFGATFTAPQYRLLRQLQQQGSATIKELSRGMLVEPATLVPMVDALERNGIVQRGADPRDRRRTPLELTDAGRELLSRVPFIHHDDLIARYLRGLTEGERQTFLGHLRGLARMLHGHDEDLRHITDAVNMYFAFGQTIEVQPEGKPASRRRAPRVRPIPGEEPSS